MKVFVLLALVSVLMMSQLSVSEGQEGRMYNLFIIALDLHMFRESTGRQ